MVKLRSKVVLLGDPTVGKTSIVKKLLDVSDFPLQYAATKGVSLETVTIPLKSKKTQDVPSTESPYDETSSKKDNGEKSFAEKEKPTIDRGEMDGDAVDMLLFDIGGLDIYKMNLPHYLKNINAYMLVYDVTNPESFMNVAKWLDSTQKALGHTEDQVVTSKATQPFGMLIANKTDAKNASKISRQQGEQFAAKHHLQFFELSAANNAVDEPFQYIASKLHQLYQEAVDQVQYMCENKSW